jgi:hypothetical protein
MFGGKHGLRKRKVDALHFAFQAAEALGPDLGVSFSIALANDSAVAAFNAQWRPINDRSPPLGGWDWEQIFLQRRGSHKEFCVTIWDDDTTLCGISLISMGSGAVAVEAFEGNPDEGHPLRGHIMPIFIDLAGHLAAKLNLDLLLIDPAPYLIDIYEREYGFQVERVGSRTRCRRRRT